MTTLLIVRHGQSEWNAAGRWQGRADPALSRLGRHQAESAAGRLGTVDLIVSSPLLRAAHTAEIISSALGVGPVVVEPDLTEREAGEWTGRTHAEIEERWPGWLAQSRRPGGYEGDESVLGRALDALARIEDAYRGADILVVSHAGVIRTLERHLDGKSGPVPNLGGRRVTHDGEHARLGERVVLVDDDDLTTPAML